MGSDDETSGGTPQRRTDGERQAIVAEAFGDGGSVSEVAERHGVSAASIHLWRRQARESVSEATQKSQGGSRPPSIVSALPAPPSASVAVD